MLTIHSKKNELNAGLGFLNLYEHGSEEGACQGGLEGPLNVFLVELQDGSQIAKPYLPGELSKLIWSIMKLVLGKSQCNALQRLTKLLDGEDQI